MVLGVLFGVLLIKQNQDIRNRANEEKENKATVCHKTGSDSHPWEQIEVSENALKAHVDHGDIIGNCPEESKGDDGDNSNGDKDDGDDSKNAGNQISQTNVVVNNSVVNNTSTTTTEITNVPAKPVYSGPTRLDFRIKFQGINSKKPDKYVRVILRKGSEEMHVYNQVMVTSDNSGVYRGALVDVKTGKYDVLIKGDAHLQRVFANINIVRGQNYRNWVDSQLLVGDFNGDNFLDIRDVASIMSFFTNVSQTVNEENKLFDLDMSGLIDQSDIDLVLTNYTGLKVEGEN